MTEAKSALDLLAEGGVLAGCVILIWALVTEKLVPKSRLIEQREERLADEERGRKAMADGMARLDIVAKRLEDVLETVETIEAHAAGIVAKSDATLRTVESVLSKVERIEGAQAARRGTR